jgi:hypothetical protein
MAKNAAKLAGLAALAGAAYLFSKKKKESEGDDTGSTRKARPEDTKTRDEDFKPSNESSYTPGSTGTARPGVGEATNDPLPKKIKPLAAADEDTKTTTPSKTKVPGGDVKRTEGRTPMPSLRSVERKVAARKDLMAAPSNQASKATDAMRNASRAQARRVPVPQDIVDQIPGQDRSGPTGGERVSGTELGRNVSNTLNALAPMGGGVGKIGAELATAGRAQRGYNAAQAARRSAEGMSPAEALAAREAATQAAREAKTLNPNAWMAGPKGMAENFRNGGKVKKMASGGMTASRRGDGIASRGKTRGKLY